MGATISEVLPIPNFQYQESILGPEGAESFDFLWPTFAEKLTKGKSKLRTWKVEKG